MHTRSRQIAFDTLLPARHSAGLRERLQLLLWPLSGTLALLAVVAAGAMLDEHDRRRDQARAQGLQAAERRAFEAGRIQGNAEMVASAEAAWRAAQTEAERRRHLKP